MIITANLSGATSRCRFRHPGGSCARDRTEMTASEQQGRLTNRGRIAVVCACTSLVMVLAMGCGHDSGDAHRALSAKPPAPPVSSGVPATDSFSRHIAPIPGTSVNSGVLYSHGAYWFATAQLVQPTDLNLANEAEVALYLWTKHGWRQQAELTVGNRDGGLAVGTFSPTRAITLGSLTGSPAPDVLLSSEGADTNFLSVISDATGKWAVVPFDDSGGVTLGETVEYRYGPRGNVLEKGIEGKDVIVAYDNCSPSCAAGKVTTVRFRYEDGVFVPVVGGTSCSGEALADAAHRREIVHRTEPADQSVSNSLVAITAFACQGGYAGAEAAGFPAGSARAPRWITFRAGDGKWSVLQWDVTGKSLPSAGVPLSVYRRLKKTLMNDAREDSSFPF